MRDGSRVSLGGVITSRRARKDKRDREYAIVTVEDFDGALEVMVFSDQLEACRSALKVDNLVAVQGTVKVRASEAGGRVQQGIPQLWADRVMSFTDSRRYLKAMVIEVREQEMDDVMLLKLKERLEAHPGSGIVSLKVLRGGGEAESLRLPDYSAEFTNELIAELRQLFGPGAVKLRGELPSCFDSGRNRRPGQGRPNGQF